MATRVEFTILIPTHDNSARTFSEAHHVRFETRARELFGGWTRYGDCSGQWVDGDHTYSDASRVYAISVPSVLDSARVRGFIIFAAKHYAQKAIYFRVLGVADIFEPNWRDGTTGTLPADAFVEEAAA